MKQIKEPIAINRRTFLEMAGFGAATLLSFPFFSSCDGRSSEAANPEVNNEFQPDIDLELKAGRHLLVSPAPP